MILITNIKNFIGLSTDTKPTDSPAGSYLTETDTGNMLRWDGDEWKTIALGINQVTKFERKDMFKVIETQLKIANIHLASLSGEEVTTMDID